MITVSGRLCLKNSFQDAIVSGWTRFTFGFVLLEILPQWDRASNQVLPHF